MEQRECFRHELKYGIGYPQYLELRSRLRPVMQTDPHGGADGRYLIRSIYFDNFTDKALREKGVASSDSYLCRKYHAEITEQECRQLLAGRTNWMRGHPAPLVRELYAKMRYQVLRPKVLVSYVREPDLYAAGNVRITFDSRIRTSLYHQEFLERQVADINASEQPRDMILEIKYDAFLPEVIRSLIQTQAVRQQAFSKYET